MKIAVTAEQPKLDSVVDSRFGRCRYFIITDTETLEWEAVENQDAVLSMGAGIAAAQCVIDRGARAVLTGLVGPKATQALNAAGVEIFSVSGGTVLHAIEEFKSGRAQSGRSPAPDLSRAAWGRGGGRCRGDAGRGMGSGMGRGAGGGRGRGRW